MRPIFVGGCPRSGTTLLGALLGAHSRCVCLPEMPFKINPLLYQDWGGGRMAWDRVAELIEATGPFRMWGIPARPADGEPAADPGDALTYHGVVESLVRRYAAASGNAGADAWVDHTPGNLERYRTLMDRFPDAVFYHIVRDGRGVAASLLPMPWSVDSVPAAARVWLRYLAHGFAAEASAPERVHRVRYEDLVRDPVAEVTRLCRLAGLDPEQQLGRSTRYTLPREIQGSHALVPRPPDPSRAEAWKDSLPSRQIEIFETETGDMLEHLGYEPMFGIRARPPTRVERARTTLQESTYGVRMLAWRSLYYLRARLRVGHPDGF